MSIRDLSIVKQEIKEQLASDGGKQQDGKEVVSLLYMEMDMMVWLIGMASGGWAGNNLVYDKRGREWERWVGRREQEYGTRYYGKKIK